MDWDFLLRLCLMTRLEIASTLKMSTMRVWYKCEKEVTRVSDANESIYQVAQANGSSSPAL
jgi:hypothetical protein